MFNLNTAVTYIIQIALSMLMLFFELFGINISNIELTTDQISILSKRLNFYPHQGIQIR